MVLGFGMARRPWMAGELLRPVSRERLLGEHVLALVQINAQFLRAFFTAVLVMVGLFLPAGLLDGRLWMMFAGALVENALLFAVIVWMLRYRSIAALILTVFLFIAVTLPSMILIDTVKADRPGAMTMLTACTVGIGIAAIVLFDGYRRWMKLEFA